MPLSVRRATRLGQTLPPGARRRCRQGEEEGEQEGGEGEDLLPGEREFGHPHPLARRAPFAGVEDPAVIVIQGRLVVGKNGQHDGMKFRL